MRRALYFTALITFIICSGSFAGSKKIGENVTVQANRSQTTIKIDGIIEESVWNGSSISSFTQKNPNEGEPATERTNVWVAYDESAIYIAAKMYDSNPDSIVGLLTRRDTYNASDWFRFYIDPYYDRRSGYFFGVNAAGAIMDGILFNDSWDDNSWNGIWDYAVHKNNEGWSVEAKIPFTQIRFTKSDDMKWGINFYRNIQRKNEEDYFIMIPKKESGFVSHFATLEGLKGVEPKQRIEILPYAVTKASYLIHDPNDPFYKSKQYSESFGADFKLGIGSNLTLDATVNPDFGQVEVDPAVVNLSAFETYYDEKRPFFIEGSNIFWFGTGGTNNNWGFNWGNPEVFYSRRIGRAPQGSIEGEGFVDYPTETRILGAAKLTGKIGDEWAVGFINATTERTYARLNNLGKISDHEIEPLSNFTIIRTQKEFNEGNSAIGLIGTGVVRNLRTDGLKNNLSDRSFVFGTDGWITLDQDETYVLTGYAVGSYVHGTKDYLIRLQQSPLRYMQRPDAEFARLDSSATSLSGFTTRLALNKQKGNFYLNSAFGIASPGFESNDAGFQFRADAINSHLVLGYRWFEPDEIFRYKYVNAAHFRGYDFDGHLTDVGYMFFTNWQFVNYYGFDLSGGYFPEIFSRTLTRGGPIAKRPSGYSLNFGGYSDNRKDIVVSVFSSYSRDDLDTYSLDLGTDIEWKPNSQISFTFGPFYSYNTEELQWVNRFADPLAVQTYGTRYVFGLIEQKQIGGNIRLNWTFTPALSLQLFIQPLFAVGSYNKFKELIRPGAYDFYVYGTDNNSTITYNSEENNYTADPDGNGPAPSFSFSNPDFNFKSLRGNLVLRWEFLPGSVFFLVWTHDRTNLDNPGHMKFGRDFKNLFRAESNNVLMAKVSYWLDI